MKKVLAISMIMLTVLSIILILAPQSTAECEVITLPAGPWVPLPGEPNDGIIDSIDSSRLDRIDLDPDTPGDQQIVIVAPGEMVTINYDAWLMGVGAEIRQLWFSYSWASSYPPWDAYTPIYNGMPGPSKDVSGEFSITAPSTPGIYKVWLCVQSQYTMEDAINQEIVPPAMLPHACIVVGKPILSATIDIKPNCLNLRSRGKWITAYIELPEGYDVNDINVSTVMLNDTVPAELHPIEVGDFDSDGIPDLMVKFSRTEVFMLVLSSIDPSEFQYQKPLFHIEKTLTVTGQLDDGTPFEGSDTIRVIFKYAIIL